MTRRSNIDERELLDPALSALLQETFQDDPALAPAPGRTERIMRAVLASEKRRPANPFWSSLVWGFGAAAVAALLLALMLGLGKLWQPGSTIADRSTSGYVKPEQPKHENPVITLQNIIPNGDGDTRPLPAPKQPDAPALTPKIPERPHGEWVPEPKTPDAPRPTVPPTPDKQEVTVAAALYEAGAAAYRTGDYETAYQAFQDSYDTVPTPEAALSTGNALMRMARDELASGNPET